MNVKTISYRRINNLGNYSSEHMEMFAELTEEDNVNDCAKGLKEYVETALGLTPVLNEVEEFKSDKTNENETTEIAF